MSTLNVNEFTDPVQGLIDGAGAPESRLPDAQPLSLTTNFVWVLAACGAILAAVPLLTGWIAGMLLN